MVDDVAEGTSGIVEKEDITAKNGPGAYWMEEIEVSLKRHDGWLKGAKDAEKVYRGEAENPERKRRMNILYSNIATMAPALFQKVPAPVVERRFKQKNPLAIAVCEIMERTLRFLSDDCHAVNEFEAVRDDYLMSGFGVPRVVYTSKTGPRETTDETGGSITAPGIVEQNCVIMHWPYSDFLTSPDERWSKKRWIAYRHRMDKAEIKRRWPAKVPFFKFEKKGDEERMFLQVDVWEIWSKRDRAVHWVSNDYETKLIATVEDPYGLRRFYPSPRPMQLILSTNDPTPQVEYALYKDQAAEVNQLTDRIYNLADKIRAVGIYAGAHSEDLAKMLTAQDGTLIAISDYAAMQEAGGLKGRMEWAPIDTLIQVLIQLYEARNVAKTDLYEVSGISDIVRGQGDSQETATAQRIKGQFATLRLDERKRQFARMVAETFAIMGEIVAEHFEPWILEPMSDYRLLKDETERMKEVVLAEGAQDDAALMKLRDAVTWEQVIRLLRDDFRRSYLIEIESEDTIEVDRQADKQARIEFLTAFVQLLQALGPIIMSGMVPFELAKEIIMFSVRGFSQARALEEVLDDFEPPPPGNEGPSPEEIKLQIEQMKVEAKAQIEQLKAQLQTEMQARDLQHETMENEKDRKLDLILASIDAERAAAEIQHREMEGAASRAHQTEEADKDRLIGAVETATGRQHESAEGEKERAMSAAESERSRQHETREAGQQRANDAIEGERARQHETAEGARARQHEAGEKDKDRQQAKSEGNASRFHESIENRAARRDQAEESEASREHEAAERERDRKAEAARAKAKPKGDK
jgi:hypothetical protein